MKCPFISRLSDRFIFNNATSLLRQYGNMCPVVSDLIRPIMSYASPPEDQNNETSEFSSVKKMYFSRLKQINEIFVYNFKAIILMVFFVFQSRS